MNEIQARAAFSRRRGTSAAVPASGKTASTDSAAERLREISTLLIREGDAEALYGQFLDAAIAVMQSDAASMQILDTESGELRLIASKGLHADSAAFWEKVGPDSGSSCGKVLETGKRVVVPDIDLADFMQGTRDLHFCRLSGIRAVQSTPLVSRSGRMLGIISTHWRRPYQPAERDLLLLDIVARQAADLIDRAEVEAALRESADRQEALIRELRERTAQLEAVLETAPAGVWFTHQRDARHAIGNRQAAAMFHAGQESNLSLSAPPDERPAVSIRRNGVELAPDELPLQRAARGEMVEEEELEFVTADGASRTVLLRASTLRDSAGQPAGAVAVAIDVTARRKAEEALLEERSHLRELDLRNKIALEAGKMGVWDWDVAENRLVWDDAEFAIYGVDPATFPLTYEGFESLVHPDDIEQFRAAAEGALEKRTPLDTEFRILRPDGQVRWISERAVNITDDRGKTVRMIGISFDITERKLSEESRSLLINELNHRVKNTLATVQSIASQSFRNSEIAAPLRKAFEARLVALSKTHDILTRRSWEGASLAEIAAQAFRPFESESAVRIARSGPDLRLSPRATLALSMAFHELATNAAKYGALSNADGRVSVNWRVIQAEGQRSLRIDWRESGGPPVEKPRRTGFGSRLIERSLAGELGGTVYVDYAREGVACVIEAPLANIAG